MSKDCDVLGLLQWLNSSRYTSDVQLAEGNVIVCNPVQNKLWIVVASTTSKLCCSRATAPSVMDFSYSHPNCYSLQAIACTEIHPHVWSGDLQMFITEDPIKFKA